jgi:hypothetical protein
MVDTSVPSKAHYLDLAGGEFASTSREDLDQLFRSLAGDPNRNTLVVHFHGGLNTREFALARVQHLEPVYRAAGAYPIFFVWQSGFIEVIDNHLRKATAEPIYGRLVRLLATFTLGRLRGQATRGVGDNGPAGKPLEEEIERVMAGEEVPLPTDPALRRRAFRLKEAELREFRTLLVNDEVVQAEIGAIANALRGPTGIAVEDAVRSGVVASGVRETLMRADVLARLRPKAGADETRAAPGLLLANPVGEIVSRVHGRLGAGRDHGMLPTVVEEVLLKLYFLSGWFGWMKSEIADAFGPDEARHGGTAFLRGLRAAWDLGYRPRIVLVGHSAGSIYICNFLDHAKTHVPDARFDVILLTPAVSFYRFAQTLKTNGAAIARLRNLTFSDPVEQADRMAPFYPRSTLYLTSGLLEIEGPDVGDLPIVGMQRFYTRQSPYDDPRLQQVVDYFLTDPARVAWVDGSPAGRAISTATSHGEFDCDPGTLATLTRLIREGL